MKIQQGNATHHSFYNKQISQTRSYNTGNTSHYATFIQHKKKNLKKDNIIQCKIHTTQNIQHKGGVLGAGLE